MTDAYYMDDLGLHANTLMDAESHLHHLEEVTGLKFNMNTTELKCFKR